MTEVADRLIDLLLNQKAGGKTLVEEEIATELRALGLSPTDAGWVLRHVFGMRMATAVHLATVSGKTIQPSDVRYSSEHSHVDLLPAHRQQVAVRRRRTRGEDRARRAVEARPS